nr:putative late blight resistance protein homolog R1B-14 [Ipomoea batatas]
MAAIVDAVVGDLANQLVHFVEENASLTVGIKGEIEELLTDLKKFGATLKQASKNEGANDNDVLKDALENMRNLKIDAEDAISKYTVEKKKHKDKGLLLRYLESPVYYARVNGLAKEIQAIKKRVAKINQDNAEAIRALIDNPSKDGQPTLPRMKQNNSMQIALIRNHQTLPLRLPLLHSEQGMGAAAMAALNICLGFIAFLTNSFISIVRTANRSIAASNSAALRAESQLYQII